VTYLESHFYDCRVEHSAELIIVEGKNAANAVNQIRRKNDQAVLAMQGKVPSVVRHGLSRRVEKNIHVRNLVTVLDAQAARRRFTRVVLLCDPDADGMHAGMLLICLLAEAYPNLACDGLLYLCRAPLYLIKVAGREDIVVYSDAELAGCPHTDGSTYRFKGVASLPVEILHRVCVDPSTRKAKSISEADCAAIKKQLITRNRS